MKYLFDSLGNHIANEINGQLHSVTGKNIGHYLPNSKFYIDMGGYYLGEVVLNNRLMHRLNNQLHSTCFGVYGNYGNCGNCGSPGNIGSIGSIAGFANIEKSRLT